ncbi:hypothetical protein GCM10010261_58880 [Streptomyces pilosus]|nr:hypothetical protein GCM10010261_58880 [Streptomyces pilosus]
MSTTAFSMKIRQNRGTRYRLLAMDRPPGLPVRREPATGPRTGGAARAVMVQPVP